MTQLLLQQSYQSVVKWKMSFLKVSNEICLKV
jgi:hypothetical protein